MDVQIEVKCVRVRKWRKNLRIFARRGWT